MKSSQPLARTFHPLAYLEGKLSVLTFVKIAQLSHGIATISTLPLKNDGIGQNVGVEGATSANVDCGVSVNSADHSILTSAPALSELAGLWAQSPKVSFKYIFLGCQGIRGTESEKALRLFEMSSLDEILNDNAAFSVQKAQASQNYLLRTRTDCPYF